MDYLGIELAAHKLENVSTGLLMTALRVAAEGINAPTLALEIIRIAQFIMLDLTLFNAKQTKSIVISKGYFMNIEVNNNIDMSKIIFQDCMIGEMRLERDEGKIRFPKINVSFIEEAIGVSSREDIPKDMLDDQTIIEKFGFYADTNREIRQQSLPPNVTVVLTALHKLFAQSGSGRKENAFSRGLNDVERTYVEDVMALISFYNFAQRQRVGGPIVWIPNRAKRAEAMSILNAPHESRHPIIESARKI